MGFRELRVEAGTKYSWAFGLEGIACRKKQCVQRIKFNSGWTEFSALLGGGGTIKFSWRDGAGGEFGRTVPMQGKNGELHL